MVTVIAKLFIANTQQVSENFSNTISEVFVSMYSVRRTSDTHLSPGPPMLADTEMCACTFDCEMLQEEQLCVFQERSVTWERETHS